MNLIQVGMHVWLCVCLFKSHDSKAVHNARYTLRLQFKVLRSELIASCKEKLVSAMK